VPQAQHELGTPLQAADSAAPPLALEANTENFFVKRFEPHFGQTVPSQWLLRTRISLSASHFPQ